MIPQLTTIIDPTAVVPLLWAIAGLFAVRRLGAARDVEAPRTTHVLRPAA